MKLVTFDDPFFSMTTMSQDDVLIDIWKMDYMFAIENIDPRVGRIKAQQVEWDFKEGRKTKTEIEMVDCTEYLEGGRLAHFELGKKKILVDNISLGRKRDATFLCPYVETDLKVRGHFGSIRFDYVKLNIEGCNLGDLCFSDEVINGWTVNFMSSRAHPSLLGDDLGNVVTQNVDYSYFKHIDP